METFRSGKIESYISRPEIHTDEYVIFVSGSGGAYDDWSQIVEMMTDSVNANMVQFTFRGRREDDPSSTLLDETVDLAKVCESIIQENPSAQISLVATSQGAASATQIATVTKYSPMIRNLILLDPADYYLSDQLRTDPSTWDGSTKYSPNGYLVSDMLSRGDINSDQRVYVNNFTLRNCVNGAYAEDRGADYPDGQARLNNKMVIAFRDKAETSAEVEYSESSTLPHAINRDGNVYRNNATVAEYLIGIFAPRES